MKFSIHFPPELDEASWEAEAKGWLCGSRIQSGGKTFAVTFYDPVRLSQDIEDEIAGAGFFVESNVIVVESISRPAILLAVERLIDAGKLELLTQEEDASIQDN